MTPADSGTEDDGARMVTCRSCGNRVSRFARRCAACGEPDPGRAVPRVSPPTAPRRPSRRRGRRLLVGVVGLVVVTAAALITAVLLRAPLEAPPLERRPSAPADVTPRSTVGPAPSRSRGRTDWFFFFKAGDRLARMGEDTPLGEVVRTEEAHAFPDGTTGPAYLLRTPAGEERVVDADELEGSAKLQ